MANNQFNSSIVNSPLILYQISDDPNSANVIFNKSRGAIVHDGDDLGTLTFYGDSGASTEVGAQIQCIINGTPALDRMPGEIRFRTRPDIAGAGLLERIKITPQGAMSIATPDLGETGLTVNGGEEVQSGNLLVSGGDITITGGDLHLPVTTSATSGVITVGGNRFIHQYAVNPAADGNAFFGLGAGNMTLTATICTGVGSNVFANLQSGVGNTATGHNSCYLMQQGTGNCAYGYAALRNATICNHNCAYGYEALANLTTSRGNVAIGQESMGNFTTPGVDLGFNTAVGYSVLGNALTGVFNSCYGYRSGTNYVGSESSNILIGHAGLAGESHHIRIGTTGGGDVQQNKTFIAGITGVTPDAVARVALCDSAGQFGTTAAMTNGQLIIGSTGANPSVATLTSTGATVTITNGAGTINLEAAAYPGGVTSWTDDTTTPIALVANTGHTANRGAGNVVYTLPAVAAYGTIIRIAGVQNGWSITQAAGQQILVGNTQTTAGAGGSITSTNARDCIELLCITANTTWTTLSMVGNLTIV